MSDSFSFFLKSIQEKEKAEAAEKSKFNPAERIEYFQRLVREFFETLEGDWFKEAVDQGLMVIENSELLITEEALGQYKTEKRRLKFGGEVIDFVPIGTIMLGTDARIDMDYKQNKVMFVHVGENVRSASDLIEIRVNGEIVKKAKTTGPVKKVWKLTYANARTIYTEATAQSVQQLIMDLVNAKA